MNNKREIKNDYAEIWDQLCDSCMCKTCPLHDKKKCGDVDHVCKTPKVRHVGVNWSSIGPVSVDEAVKFARLVLKRSLQAQTKISKYMTRGVRILPFCREHNE